MIWILLLALPLVGGLAWWARWLGGKYGAPRWVRHVAWAPIAVWVVSLAGTIYGLVAVAGSVKGKSADPSQKARVLAEGIATGMNATALAVLVLGVMLGIIAAVLGVVTVRLKPPPEAGGSPPYR